MSYTIDDIDRGYPWIREAPDYEKKKEEEPIMGILRTPVAWLEDTLDDIDTRPQYWTEEEHKIVLAELNSLLNLMHSNKSNPGEPIKKPIKKKNYR